MALLGRNFRGEVRAVSLGRLGRSGFHPVDRGVDTHTTLRHYRLYSYKQYTQHCTQ